MPKFATLMKKSVVITAVSMLAFNLLADVAPLTKTEWGQSSPYTNATPGKSYPGCATIATAQLLYYYHYKNQAVGIANYALVDQSVSGGQIYVDFSQYTYDYANMALNTKASSTNIQNTAEFIYHVGASIKAQFSAGDSGTLANANYMGQAFKNIWGYNTKIYGNTIAKEAFGLNDNQWANAIKAELDAGRPVLYMAQQSNTTATVGHAFIIDGYRNSDGKFHVNFGWNGRHNGYYDTTFTDPGGRRWDGKAMIFTNLEPQKGYALKMLGNETEDTAADLTIEEVKLNKTTISANETVRIDAVTRNIGKSDAVASRIAYYLSKDSLFDKTDKYLGYDSVAGLTPGSSENDYLSKILTPTLLSSVGGAGSCYIIVVADVDNTNDESNEDNNFKAIEITIK